MKVKLLKTVPNLGRASELVEVSDAQARNFLIPKKIAVVATTSVVQAHIQQATNQQQQADQRQQAIEALLEKIRVRTIRLLGKANQQGKLFAAIKSQDIKTALEKEFAITLPGLVCRPDHLKTLGQHQVQITLDPEHQATITISIDHEK